ncbi:hypothetical protein N0824_00358 [Microcystis sp. 0824]|uniref:class I SAM-dependent methyltransferase n=1 Tax=Microcystis sp. 0824 TaxID=1502726 RepID=UPI000D0C1BB4|nr:class I SAM-dependent methyltransferase [Microcystis sp. 0824]GBF52512.1 hypothetical protein N0824_00358 [Microcystis sp. 0824]
MIEKCRLCYSNNLEKCLYLPHSSPNISKLLKKTELNQDKPIDVHVYNCKQCGFVQIADILESSYYDDYLMTISHSPQMRTYQLSQASNFVQKYNLVGKRLVEIGCGDGNYLGYLRDLGTVSLGIEPSASFRDLAISKGLKVFSGYVSCDHLIPESPYDAFVTRQVLEHIPDIHQFLQGIRLSMRENAVGLVEVPSLEQAIENSRFYDFFPDHLNYFSQRTLRYALLSNGFSVLDLRRGMNGEYLEAIVKVDPQPSFQALQESVETLTRDIACLLTQARSQGKRVAIWGSGAKGITTLAVARVSGIEYVIDSDPYKQGLFTPVSHLPVVSPEELRKNPVDIVIITAMAYRDEIINQLRNNLKFTGAISFLGKGLQFWVDSDTVVDS